MNVVAILQNQWFNEPARIAQIYAEHGTTPEDRADLNARFLFYRSLTGRRLQAAFGAACESIIWEEASPRVASQSDGAFPADLAHIRGLYDHFKPSVILAFGTIAQVGVLAVVKGMPPLWAIGRSPTVVIKGPHPAARHANVPAELRGMADQLAALLVETP